jgi:hypothetical protein
MAMSDTPHLFLAACHTCEKREMVLKVICVLSGPALLLAACSGAPVPAVVTNPGPPTQDAATRTTPVVPGRPARVFVFAGWDAACAQLAAPEVQVASPPAQGEITFRPGQQTTIAASGGGTCTGRTVSGTGVYYTAREGASGTDRFTVEARLQTGETNRRVFEVTIAN